MAQSVLPEKGRQSVTADLIEFAPTDIVEAPSPDPLLPVAVMVYRWEPPSISKS